MSADLAIAAARGATGTLDVAGVPVDRLRFPEHPRGAAATLNRWVRLTALADAAAAEIAVLIGATVRFVALGQGFVGVDHIALICALPPLWTMTLLVAGGYDRRFLAAGAEEFHRVANAGVWLLGAVVFASYAFDARLSRGFVAITVPLVIILALLVHLSARRLLQRRILAGLELQRVVVAGSRAEVRELVRHIRRMPHAGISVLGACVPGSPKPISLPDLPIPVLGSVDDVVAVAMRSRADTIAVAGTTALNGSQMRRLSWRLEGSGVTLVIAPAITEIAGPRILVRPLNGLPFLHVAEPEFSGAQRAVKDVIDRAVAALLLLALSPALLGIAAAVRLTSRGPVLFHQVRVGRGSRRFTLFKFRTMIDGADRMASDLAAINDRDGCAFKVRSDPRVTRVGHFLRRYSLDELPQLWNVLTGSMSLVGPRPPLPDEVERYDGDVQRRLLVKPGMTGLWQVNGRADLSWEETVRLDLHYVEHWSVALDALVLCKTLTAVVSGRGAY